MTLLTFLAGALVGAGAMFLLLALCRISHDPRCSRAEHVCRCEQGYRVEYFDRSGADVLGCGDDTERRR